MATTSSFPVTASGFPATNAAIGSEAWDDELGFVEPHTLHAGDPVRRRMAEERQMHSAVRLDPSMLSIVIETVGGCHSASDWQIHAASIEPTHTHLLITYSDRDIDNTVKWLKDQTTKAIHRETYHTGPVWCKGRWRSFIYDDDAWNNTLRYIERHNERRGVGARPYPFLT